MRLFFAALSFLVLMSSMAYAQNVKIGVVDFRRVITSSQKGKSIASSVEAQFGPRAKSLEAKKQQLEAMEKDFINNAAVMNETSRQQKAEQLDQMKKDFTRSFEDYQYELQKKDLEITSQIRNDMQSIIKSIGQSGGYTLIVDAGTAAYFTPSTDITDQVIKAYDAK